MGRAGDGGRGPGLARGGGGQRPASDAQRDAPGHPRGPDLRDLARRTGLAPASVSEHTQVLRRAGLTEVRPNGTRVTHRVSPLGWALLLRSA
jgi:DNA-binding transcriptional ArsR family regulator